MRTKISILKILSLFFFIVAAGAASALWAKPWVALDAGHGGSDPGILAGSAVEKEWNMKITLALQKAFQDAGYDVVMIRKKDETISNEKRAQAANVSGASAVICVHADRDWTFDRKGPMLVVEPPNRADSTGAGEVQRWGFVSQSQYRSSLRLAKSIGEQLGVGGELSNLSDSRGLVGETSSPEGAIFCLPHEALRYLTPPSVVLIPMFLTSASDLKKFSDAGFLADFASRVAKGAAIFLQGMP